MAKDKKPSTSSCFLSCFGISKARARPAGTRSDSDGEKPRGQLPLPRFWAKKSGAKTVPVDAAAAIDVDVKSEKAEAKRRYDESRLRLKSEVRRSKSPEKLRGSERRAAAAAAASDQDDPPPRELSVQIRTEVTAEQNPVHERLLDQPVPDPNGSAQPQRRLPFRRKIDSLKPGTGGSSQPGSPLLRTRPGPISRSASFPLPPRKKLKQCDDGVSRNLDPVVGMSIVMVTLIIMVLWGRLCAVLCTCAWFYFIPRMRPTGRSDGGEGADPDPDPIGSYLGSGEYKKRVVLEGLLERDRRSSLTEKRVT